MVNGSWFPAGGMLCIVFQAGNKLLFLASVEIIWRLLVCSHRLYMCTVTRAFACRSKTLHIMVGIFSLDNLYLAGKISALISELWGHPTRNKQKQGMLGYGWEFPLYKAVH